MAKYASLISAVFRALVSVFRKVVESCMPCLAVLVSSEEKPTNDGMPFARF
jgi:hypothetical protein